MIDKDISIDTIKYIHDAIYFIDDDIFENIIPRPNSNEEYYELIKQKYLKLIEKK